MYIVHDVKKLMQVILSAPPNHLLQPTGRKRPAAEQYVGLQEQTVRVDVVWHAKANEADQSGKEKRRECTTT